MNFGRVPMNIPWLGTLLRSVESSIVLRVGGGILVAITIRITDQQHGKAVDGCDGKTGKLLSRDLAKAGKIYRTTLRLLLCGITPNH